MTQKCILIISTGYSFLKFHFRCRPSADSAKTSVPIGGLGLAAWKLGFVHTWTVSLQIHSKCFFEMRTLHHLVSHAYFKTEKREVDLISPRQSAKVKIASIEGDLLWRMVMAETSVCSSNLTPVRLWKWWRKRKQQFPFIRKHVMHIQHCDSCVVMTTAPVSPHQSSLSIFSSEDMWP